MADDPKEQQKREQADLVFDLLKEQTSALVENTRELKTVNLNIVGQDGTGPDNEGAVPGLLDRLADLEEAQASLQEAVDALDGRLIGLNLKLSCVEFVLDRLAEVAQGDAGATTPVPARALTWEDAVRAKRDYDRKVEEEMVAAAEAAEKDAAAEEADAEPEPALAKPMMMSNKAPPSPSVLRALPPLPVAQPRPG